MPLMQSAFSAAVVDQSKTFKIKGGYNVPLAGAPEERYSELGKPETVSLRPTDFRDLKLKLLVREGDRVKIGTPLMQWKTHPDVKFVSPGAGEVTHVEFGPRRVVQRIDIKLNQREYSENFETVDANDVTSLTRQDVIDRLSAGGLWPLFIRRPFGKIADPTEVPRCIFINGMDTNPAAPNPYFLVKDKLAQVKTAIDAIVKLCSAETFLILPEDIAFEPFELAGLNSRPHVFEVHRFKGKHPAGLVGTHIDRLAPIRMTGDVHWTLRLQDLPLIAELLTEGKFLTERRIAVTGPGVKEPHYIETRLGVSFSDLLNNQVVEDEGELRYISGSVLTGLTQPHDGVTGFYDSSVTVLKEGKRKELVGWMMPGFNKLTITKAFVGFLNPKREWKLDTNLNGAIRPFIVDDLYDDYVGVDIMPTELMKAILVEDIERCEQLGLLDVIEEDVALCTYVCPSKIEFGKILRDGLDFYEKES